MLPDSSPLEYKRNMSDAGIKTGSDECFSALFKEYYGSLYSYAVRLLADETEAEECVHNTFCHLWDVRNSIEIKDSVRSYLFRAVYNRAISSIRQKKLSQDMKKRVFLSSILPMLYRLPRQKSS
ncbi:MAG: sigma-70 family RNA polymerase sigma factor [Bacteroidales bacterium]|nr:sigma-70 family RNA polymerase sigma factor [Bacteroidales bacterium]